LQSGVDFWISDLFSNGKSGGPRHHGQEGVAVPCWRASTRAHLFSPVVAKEDEPDEAVPEACSLEHERWWRGSVSVKKTGSGSVGEWRRGQKAWKRGVGGAGMSEGGGALL
jgi:hypothetical protein